MSVHGLDWSATQWLPHYRDMAADGMRLAARAETPAERERYLQAAEYWNRRAAELERALERLDGVIASVAEAPRPKNSAADCW